MCPERENEFFLCWKEDLGLIDYEEAYVLQKERVQQAIAQGKQWLLVCEHPTVLTLGRLSHQDNVLISAAGLQEKGIRALSVDRGGDVTLHCPGQLVIYPILNLRNFGQDLKDYLRKLEQVAIDFLSEFDIVSDRISGRTGVWVGQKKIASIGIGVKSWVTYHGMAININTPLNLFSLIRPCGLDVAMTSVKELKGMAIDEVQAKNILFKVFNSNFPVRFETAAR